MQVTLDKGKSKINEIFWKKKKQSEEKNRVK